MPELARTVTETTRRRRVVISVLILLVGLAPVELAIFLFIDPLWMELILVLAIAVPVAIGLGVWVRRADSMPERHGHDQIR